MRRSCLLLLTALAAHEVNATSWMHITQTANGAEVAIDRETFEPKDGWVRVWVRYDYTGVPSEKARALVLQQEFNCNGRYARIVSSTFYAPDGKVMSTDTRASDYAPVKPGSVNEGIGKAACAMGAERSGP